MGCKCAVKKQDSLFAAYCVECLLKHGICKKGKVDHLFNMVPIVSFSSTTGLMSLLYSYAACF